MKYTEAFPLMRLNMCSASEVLHLINYLLHSYTYWKKMLQNKSMNIGYLATLHAAI